jgi:hypothetical protein
MDWNQIYNQLAKEMDALSGIAATLQESGVVPIESLFEMEPREREAIDDASRQYAATGRLPALNQHQGVLFYIRLGHAAKFAKFLSHAKGEDRIFPENFSDSQIPNILEFLLVDYWHFAGWSRWRTT